MSESSRTSFVASTISCGVAGIEPSSDPIT
jgi:hypothetical protein